jgi:hypothetical protein
MITLEEGNPTGEVKKKGPNDTNENPVPNKPAGTKNDIIDSLLNNPIIKKVQEELDARIIKVDDN